jgi:hypothetical protein
MLRETVHSVLMFQTRRPSGRILTDRLAVGVSRVPFEVISIQRKIILS